MTRNLLYLLLIILFIACKRKENDQKGHYPSKEYEYIKLATSKVPSTNRVYVPIYSHIYLYSGKRVKQITATLSIRSTNFTDSFYVSKIDYYSSEGKLIKRYIDKILLLKPMHSVEFVVQEEEAEGGAGANFIVEWSSSKPETSPLIQAIMISTSNGAGISFTTEGVKVPG